MKPVFQSGGLQSVEIEGGSVKLGRKPGKGRTQISPVEISDRMGTGGAKPAAQTLRFSRKGGAGGFHQMGRSVRNCRVGGGRDRTRSIDVRETVREAGR